MNDLNMIEGAYYPSEGYGVIGSLKLKHLFRVLDPWIGLASKDGEYYSFTNDGKRSFFGDNDPRDLDLTKPMKKDGSPWFQNNN
jgi:hypothetical protein